VEEWTHFKVNYHGATPITENHKKTMHQINAKADSTDIDRDYYISLKNEALKVSVTNVPRYYIFIWKVVVSAKKC
jgi:hypothetical protein